MTQSTITSRSGQPTDQRARGPRTRPLDRSDPRVEAARDAEARAYEGYGCEYAEHFVDVDALGLTMRVVVVGTGPPLVLITGGTGVGLEWLPLLPELEGYTLYVVDRPGGGLSDGIDHRSMPFREQAVVATTALFDHFDLDAAPIVGNSVGGNWAIQFALDHPERVSSVVLLGCPAFYPGTSAPLPMRLGSVPVVGGLVFALFVRPDDSNDARGNWEFLGQADETVEGLPEAYAEAWYRMQNTPQAELAWISLLQTIVRIRGGRPSVALTGDDLRGVTVPVSLVWGRADPFGSVERGRAGAEYFPTAEFHEVDAGHLPWLDVPETCGELVREFVSRHG